MDVVTVTGQNALFGNPTLLDQCVGRRDVGGSFFIGPQPFDRVRELPVFHLAVRSNQEAVVVDLRKDAQARDQADVRPFGRFNRTDPPVVGDVHVADFEPGPLAVESARPQRAEPPLVRQHRKRIGLVDHLRQLAASEEILDGGRDALGVDQRSGRHLLDVLEAHAFLHRPAELEEALADLVGGQLVDRPQAAVPQVVDVVDLRFLIVARSRTR